MSRLLITVLWITFLLPIGCKGKAAKSDEQQIQGTWEMITVEGKGQVVFNYAEAKEKPRWVFAGDKVNIMSAIGDNQFTFTLHPKASPKQIDLFGPLDNNKLGIYELKGDEFKVCQVSVENGAARPTEFNSKARGVLIFFRRVKS